MESSLQVDRFRTVIATAVPRLASSQVSVLGAGQFNVAVRCGDLVFRFATHAVGVEKLRMEARLLEAVGGLLPVPTPRPVHVSLDAQVGEAFVAHRFIPGAVVERSATAAIVRAAGPEVGRFLAALHAIDLRAVPDVVPRMNVREFAEVLRTQSEELLFPRMDAASRARVSRELDAMSALDPAPQALCHCDIGGQVLFDSLTGSVGVIDFGEAMVSDPVLDVASLSVLGEEFVGAAAREYPLIAELAAAARTVRATFVLQDALAGALQDDFAYADAVMSGYGAAGQA